MTIRPADPDRDAAACAAIYAPYVEATPISFELVPPDAAEFARRISNYGATHQFLVAEEGGEVIGYAYACRWADRAAYDWSVETSVYVAESARGRGVGKTLLHRQVNEADARGLWTLQTSVFPENRASIALHHAAGFRTLAVRSRIARLDGIWRDTVLLERRRAHD